MKKWFIVSFVFLLVFFRGQSLDNIQPGEVLSYRIHYGFLNAGNATLATTKSVYGGQPHLYVKGVGRTTGAVGTFFKVQDIYESYINLNTGLPSFYVRNVSEGSYRQHFQTVFDHDKQTLVLTDKKNPKNAPRTIKTVKGVQDMLSAFYYLRSFSPGELKVGTVKNVNVWIDDELFPFRLKVAGIDRVKTKFGTVNCLRIVPSVISGRVFKEKEGVTLWVTNDANHIPISIKAELAVGSLKADIENYKNIKYPINFQK